MRQSLVLLIVVLFGGGLLFVALTSRPQENPISGSREGVAMSDPTDTPTFVPHGTPGPEFFSSRFPAIIESENGEPGSGIEAVYTAQEAISLTLELLPSGFTPTQVEARLVTYSTLMEQFLGMSPGGYESTQGPSWLVGVVGAGLTDVDILPPPTYLPNFTPDPPTAIPGAFFAWDANSTYVVSQGFLESAGPTSMATILAFVNASVPIETATDVPLYGGETPTPSPTP